MRLGKPDLRLRLALISVILSALIVSGPTDAAEPSDPKTLCALIEDAATQYDLPPPFFARLIWKESRFDPGAISHAGAQGIAQFMPATARLRGLTDPFDPAEAIPKSAAYLAELRDLFGNLGLAAAAYNSGEGRVAAWLRGKGGLPGETRDYVYSITTKPAEWFREPGRVLPDLPLDPKASFADACARLPVMETRTAPRPPWGVVIAGGRTQRAALIAFERARRQAPTVIAASNVHVIRKGRKTTGPLYTARIGAESRSEARRICLRITRAGQTCYIRQN